MDEWSDAEFLQYVESHSETERHLFSRAHANRLLRLAGRPEQELPALIAINKWTARELVDLARAALGVEVVAPVVSEQLLPGFES